MFELRIGERIVSIESASEVQAFVDTGKATAETPIRKLGETKWIRLRQVKWLRFPEESALPSKLPIGKKASIHTPDLPPVADFEQQSISPIGPSSISKSSLAIGFVAGGIVSAIVTGTLFFAVLDSKGDSNASPKGEADTPKAAFETQVLLDLSDVPPERVFWEQDGRNIKIRQVFWTPIAWDLVETTSQRFPLTARVEHHTSVSVFDVEKQDVSLDEAKRLVMETSPSRVNVSSQHNIITEKHRVILINDYGLNWNGDTVDAPLIEVFRRMENLVDQSTKSREYREKNRNTDREHKRNLSWIPCNVNGVEVTVMNKSYYSVTEWKWDLENRKWEQQASESSLYPYTDKDANYHSIDFTKELKLNAP